MCGLQGIEVEDKCLQTNGTAVIAGAQEDCEMSHTGFMFIDATLDGCQGSAGDPVLVTSAGATISDRAACEIEPTGNSWVVNTSQACAPVHPTTGEVDWVGTRSRRNATDLADCQVSNVLP